MRKTAKSPECVCGPAGAASGHVTVGGLKRGHCVVLELRGDRNLAAGIGALLGGDGGGSVVGWTGPGIPTHGAGLVWEPLGDVCAARISKPGTPPLPAPPLVFCLFSSLSVSFIHPGPSDFLKAPGLLVARAREWCPG